jgi:hypothetical protein
VSSQGNLVRKAQAASAGWKVAQTTDRHTDMEQFLGIMDSYFITLAQAMCTKPWKVGSQSSVSQMVKLEVRDKAPLHLALKYGADMSEEGEAG